MDKKHLVYMHTSLSGKSYIGLTCNLTKRSYAHREERRKCEAFKSAIKKYGWGNFTHKILIGNLSIDEANYWEDFYINQYNSISPNGYNLKGGGRSTPMSNETKEKISKANKGRVIPIEQREKISKSLTGRKLSDDHRENLKGRVGIMKNKTHSDETKRKISISKYGVKTKPCSEERKIKIGDAHRGREIQESAREKMSMSAKERNNSPNKSKYIGVCYHPSTNKWRSVIMFKRVSYHLGLFATEDLAHAAYCSAKNNFNLTIKG